MYTPRQGMPRSRYIPLDIERLVLDREGTTTMKRIPPPREYAKLTFDDKMEVIETVFSLLRAYAETERPKP
jgi:hypothetical protein